MKQHSYYQFVGNTLNTGGTYYGNTSLAGQWTVTSDQWTVTWPSNQPISEPISEPIMFTKDKSYGVYSNSIVLGPYTAEEAKSVASEQAHKTKGRTFILKVAGTESPEYKTVSETW